jgi:hypothetical protein
MGRPREKHFDLLPRMSRDNGAYYLRPRIAGKQVRIPLGYDLDRAKALARQIESGEIDPSLYRYLDMVRPLDELAALPEPDHVRGSGVYFLWLGGSLKYVGRATKVYRRVSTHTHRGSFDWATAIACNPLDSVILEAIHIIAYRPSLNKEFWGIKSSQKTGVLELVTDGSFLDNDFR